MKKLLQSLCFVALGLSSFSASALEPLKVGTECTYPPYTYRDANGNIEGFDVDLAREVAKRLDREAVFVCQPFDSSIPALQAHKFDVLFTAISVTPEREKSVSFSVPYRSTTASFVGAKTLNIKIFDEQGNALPNALKGLVVGLQRSSTYEQYIKETFPGAKIQFYDTFNNMLLDLRAKRIDLVIGGTLTLAMNFIDKEGGDKFKFIDKEIDRTDYFGVGVAAGIRKDDVALKEQVDAALEAMFKDGTFKAINQKYWEFSVLPHVWQ